MNSIPDRLRRIREWRDRSHPGDPVISGMHWHDVNLLLNESDRIAAERDVLAAIARDLAAAAGFDECVFCPSENGRLDPTSHADSCPYGRARAWLASQEPTQ